MKGTLIEKTNRALSGAKSGTNITNLLQDYWGEEGRIVGMTINGFSTISGIIAILNFVIGRPLPISLVASLTIVVGMHAVLETGVGSVIESENTGFRDGLPSPSFMADAILFAILLGFVTGGLWILLGTEPMGQSVFFGSLSLVFLLWSRTDW